MADLFCIDEYHTQNGVSFDVDLAYRTLGSLNADGDNAVVVTTSYAAQDDEAELLISGENGIDLDSYFVVLINMVSNGLSSSPSNAKPPFDGPRFPRFTVHDNVACQRKLIDALGITRVRLVSGFSMGGLQSFEWGSQHADIVDAILPICGAARVSPHNWLFLDSARAALELDPAFADGDYESLPEAGLRAFARVYAGWALSQAFFRDALYTTLGLDSVEGVVGLRFNYFARRDVNDLLGMLWTWQHADISKNSRFEGDFGAALGVISARAIVMPGSTDLYFTVADSEFEVSHMPNAELRPIESPFGHFAGSGQVPEGKAMIDQAIADLLDS
jgi:homoserine O-acetyltransferase/O-succinyltransferase